MTPDERAEKIRAIAREWEARKINVFEFDDLVAAVILAAEEAAYARGFNLGEMKALTESSGKVEAKIREAVEEALVGTIALELHQKVVIDRKAEAYEDAAKVVEQCIEGRDLCDENLRGTPQSFAKGMAARIRAKAGELGE